MTPMTQAAAAELDGLAAASCPNPQRAENVVVGRCGECPTCRAHDRMMLHLRWLRWLREAHRPEEDCFPAATVGQVLALTEPEG